MRACLLLAAAALALVAGRRQRVPVRRLRSGRHRLRVRAIDAAGNRTRRVVRFRRCAR